MNPHTPRVMRRDNAQAKTLLEMEVPECDCPLSRLCLSGHPGYPAKCKGKRHCKLCPQAPDPDHPCPHAATADHDVDLADWVEMLQSFDKSAYTDPPIASEPHIAVTRGGRIALYALRMRKGLALRHPHDITLSDLDRLGIEAFSGKRSGGVLAAGEDDNGEEG